MKLIDGIKNIFNKSPSVETVDINDPRFWRKFGNSSGEISEVTYMV